MLQIKFTSRFVRDWKVLRRKHYDQNLLETVMSLLAAQTALPAKYRDHALTGEWKEHRECHLKPDWLLIYYRTETVLIMVATGSHDDMFK